MLMFCHDSFYINIEITHFTHFTIYIVSLLFSLIGLTYHPFCCYIKSRGANFETTRGGKKSQKQGNKRKEKLNNLL